MWASHLGPSQRSLEMLSPFLLLSKNVLIKCLCVLQCTLCLSLSLCFFLIHTHTHTHSHTLYSHCAIHSWFSTPWTTAYSLMEDKRIISYICFFGLFSDESCLEAMKKLPGLPGPLVFWTLLHFTPRGRWHTWVKGLRVSSTVAFVSSKLLPHSVVDFSF